MTTSPSTSTHTDDANPATAQSRSPGPTGASPQPQGSRRLRTRLAELPPIAGFSLAGFAVLGVVVLAAAWADIAQPTILVAFGITMILGSLLHWIGQQVPVLRDFGLPIILCLIAPALLVYWDLLPASFGTMMTEFYSNMGFIDFIVVAVIVGSIAGLPRKLLMKILVRFIVPLAGVVLIVFALAALLGLALGYHWVYTLLFIAAPVMAGGLPMGALPMSEMYAAQLNTGAEQYLSVMMSGVVIANTLCILLAALLNGIGKRAGQRFLGFNGEGQLLRIQDDSMADVAMEASSKSSSYTRLAQGLMICGAVLLTGLLLAEVLPVLHQYAWMVIVMALVKIFNLFPEEWNEACSNWGDFVMGSFIPAFLVALSVGIIDIAEIINAVSTPSFVFMVISIVVLAGVVSAALGWLVKFNMIEAAIAPGLIMADMGGSGDVAVLSAAGRMQLMPFAAIATRFGGVLALFLTTLIVPLLQTSMLP